MIHQRHIDLREIISIKFHMINMNQDEPDYEQITEDSEPYRVDA